MSDPELAGNVNQMPGAILVTGGSGFVGRALLPGLQQACAETRIAVRRPANIQGEIVVGDIGPCTEWAAALAGCGAVVHLAARAHLMHDRASDPLAEYRYVNTAGTLRLAREAAKAGVRRFIFASSIKVNGEGRAAPYTEADIPSPEDPYAISKWEAEQGLRELSARTGMETVILRIPLVYGPGVAANFLRLLRAVENGFPLPFGYIENRRSLIYLGNLVDILLKCLADPNAANRTFLVSDGEDVSTPELIKRIAAALHRRARLWSVPTAILRAGGLLTGKRREIDRLLGSLAVDSRVVRQTLGWVPPYTLQDGLQETVRWFRETAGQSP